MKTKDTILVITSSGYPAVDPVVAALERIGERVFRLDTDKLPGESVLTMELSGGRLCGTIRHLHPPDDSLPQGVELERVKSCWYRGVRQSRISQAAGDQGRLRFIREESKAALWSLYSTLDAYWVNPPLVGVSLLEGNKLYQSKVAARVGMLTPETIVTNSAEELMGFCRQHGGEIAVKMLGGHVFVRSGKQDFLTVYTQRVSEHDIEENSDAIGLTPVFAQRYIPKAFELRVTVVGGNIFACSIDSQASAKTKDDWRRYDFENVEHSPYQLPTYIAERLLEFMGVLGLRFGAIDMIVTPNGDYIFLEVNPQGQWGWIEELTGMPITKAIADLLANPPQCR